MTADLFARLDANLVESIRETARWQDGATCIEPGGLLVVAGCTPWPAGYSNCAVRVDSSLPAAQALDHAQDFFAQRGRGFTMWVRPTIDEDIDVALAERGLEPMAQQPWMTLDRRVDPANLTDGIELRRVDDPAGIADCRSVNAEAYRSLGMPARETAALYGELARLAAPHLIHYVAYVDGRPAATAMGILTGDIVGIYWVGTVEAARFRGLAEACTRAVGNDGFARGATLAFLQASPMGEPTYRRIGYRTVGRQKWYVHFHGE